MNRERNWGSQRLSNLPKVMQLGSGEHQISNPGLLILATSCFCLGFCHHNYQRITNLPWSQLSGGHNNPHTASLIKFSKTQRHEQAWKSSVMYKDVNMRGVWNILNKCSYFLSQFIRYLGFLQASHHGSQLPLSQSPSSNSAPENFPVRTLDKQEISRFLSMITL